MLQMIEVQYLFFNAHSPYSVFICVMILEECGCLLMWAGHGSASNFVQLVTSWMVQAMKVILHGGEVICAHKVDEYCSYNYMISSMSAAYMLPYNVGELAQFREFQQWRLVFTEG